LSTASITQHKTYTLVNDNKTNSKFLGRRTGACGHRTLLILFYYYVCLVIVV